MEILCNIRCLDKIDELPESSTSMEFSSDNGSSIDLSQSSGSTIELIKSEISVDYMQAQFISQAEDAITISLVYQPQGKKLKDHCQIYEFKPKLVHQIFPHMGRIYGYKDLKINIKYLANSMKTFMETKYSSQVTNFSDYEEPTNIKRSLNPWLPIDFCIKENSFNRCIAEEDYTKIYGQPIFKFNKYHGDDESPCYYTITQCDINEPGFKIFHQRFETMIVWFIDAASQIDVSDENWLYYYIYKIQHIKVKGKEKIKHVLPIGFCTAYKFYHYPDKIRARISQFFVMPPYQRKGLGSILLRNVYNSLATLNGIIDFQVEDPCIEFQRMRDIVDCELLAQLDCFKPPNILKGLTFNMYEEANRQFKIHKKQCIRIHKILSVFYITQNVINLDNIENLGQDILKYLVPPSENKSRRGRTTTFLTFNDRESLNVNDNTFEYIQQMLSVVNCLHAKSKI